MGRPTGQNLHTFIYICHLDACIFKECRVEEVDFCETKSKIESNGEKSRESEE